MSRVGQVPVDIPDGVDVKIQKSLVTVKGPKGELKWNYPAGIKVSVQDKTVIVERPAETKQLRSLHGTTRSLIANMVTGTTTGYKREMSIIGVGYRAQVQGQKITFTLGYSHPIVFNLPEGVTAQVDKKQTQLVLEGIDKYLVGQVAANIRSLRPPNIYKGKGIRYADEVIKLKVGKAGK
jgi:large subunit ribosomal protein L6